MSELVKPANCTCVYPTLVVRNMNGHEESCPVYVEWAARIALKRQQVEPTEVALEFCPGCEEFGVPANAARDRGYRFCLKCPWNDRDRVVAGMRAYQVNDYEWVAVPAGWSREQIEAWHLEETQIGKDDADYYENFEEVPLDATIITDDTPDGEKAKTTVRAEIEDYVARNGVEAFLLACTEE